MASNSTSNIRDYLVRLFVGIEPREYVAVAWSFSYFFCVLSSYYIIRPVRETMAVGSGSDTVPYLFLGTFTLMMIATPIFGRVTSKYPRKTFLPWVYLFFISNMLIFWLVFSLYVDRGTDHIWLGRIYFVWLSVFNLFVVSVFWSFMADIYTREQGRRLFGFITAGGGLGSIVGSALTREFVVQIGFQNLFLVSAIVLSMAIPCIHQLRRWVSDENKKDDESYDPEKPLGGNPLAGITHLFSSNYFLGIVANSIIASLLGTALYMFGIQLVEESIAGANAQTEFFSNIDLWANLFAFIGQLFLVRYVVQWFGIGRSLVILPVVSIIGFVSLGLDPTLTVVALLTSARRAIGFSFSKPPTDMLYSVVSREDKYKVKNFIDTSVYRFGDIVGSWSVKYLLVLGLSGVSYLMVPFAAAWAIISLWLGRDYKRKAIALKRKGLK